MKLELGLIRLSEQANADQLLFWGKVVTTSTPYYIAVALDFKGHYAFPYKKFFYRLHPPNLVRKTSSSLSYMLSMSLIAATSTTSTAFPSLEILRPSS